MTHPTRFRYKSDVTRTTAFDRSQELGRGTRNGSPDNSLVVHRYPGSECVSPGPASWPAEFVPQACNARGLCGSIGVGPLWSSSSADKGRLSLRTWRLLREELP